MTAIIPRRFPLTAKANMLAVRRVMEMSDQDDLEVLKESRWGSGYTVACSCSGVVDK